MHDCKLVSKDVDEILYRADSLDRVGHWTFVVEGEVIITRTLDEEEVGQGKTADNSFFGAFRSLQKAFLSSSIVVEEEPEEKPLKEGGTGVHNTIIKAATPVKLMQMRLSRLLQIIGMKGRSYQFLMQACQLEAPSRDLKLPLLSFENYWEQMIIDDQLCDDGIDSDLMFFNREKDQRFHNGLVSEPERKKIKEALVTIDKIWGSISMGAPMVPKGTMSLIEEHLGEGGIQLYHDLVKPLSQLGAPESVLQEHFWFCCIEFLSETTIVARAQPEFQTVSLSFADDSHGAEKGSELDGSTHGGSQQGRNATKDEVPRNMHIFSETETLRQKLIGRCFHGRRIKHRFFNVSPVVLEREYLKVAGNLTEPLMGDSIRQYLKYTIVDHPYPISLANCREFCELFGKRFERSTKIMHSDVIKLLRDYRLQGQPQDGLTIESALNPLSIQMRGWVLLMRMVKHSSEISLK